MIGDEMKQAVSGYLQTLYDQNSQAVGGALPDDAFYYYDPQFIEQPAA
jgi:NitT/TauT family transport system substrate-binding protein